MAYKDIQKQRDAWNRWYKNNKEKQRTSVLARRKALKQWFRDYKSKLCCARCPENHPACLQFHHTDPETKEISISQAVHSVWTVERIEQDVLIRLMPKEGNHERRSKKCLCGG